MTTLMFESNVIFQINQVWEANKPTNGEIKQKEELASNAPEIKPWKKNVYWSNRLAIKNMKRKLEISLTFFRSLKFVLKIF